MPARNARAQTSASETVSARRSLDGQHRNLCYEPPCGGGLGVRTAIPDDEERPEERD